VKHEFLLFDMKEDGGLERTTVILVERSWTDTPPSNSPWTENETEDGFQNNSTFENGTPAHYASLM
jgi:hypothetical protein